MEIAASLADCEEAFEVSLRAFYPAGAPAAVASMWRSKWFNDPSFRPESVLIERREGRIRAGLRFIRRTIRISGADYRMMGIGEIFVAPEAQRSGLTRQLVTGLLTLAENLHDEVTVVVGRRAIDNFYLPYGFWGVGSYPETIITCKNIAPSPLEIEDFSPSDSELCNQAYRASYAATSGWIHRDGNHLTFLRGQVNSAHRVLQSFRRDGIFRGYFVADGSVVQEIGMLDGEETVAAIHALLAHLPQTDNRLTLRIPPQHAFFHKDLHLDVSHRLRECFYGGHVLRITDLAGVLTKYQERQRNFYRANGIGPCAHEFDGIRTTWDGARVEVDLGSATAKKLTYRQTLLLLGIEARYAENRLPASACPATPFHLPAWDEF